MNVFYKKNLLFISLSFIFSFFIFSEVWSVTNPIDCGPPEDGKVYIVYRAEYEDEGDNVKYSINGNEEDGKCILVGKNETTIDFQTLRRAEIGLDDWSSVTTKLQKWVFQRGPAAGVWTWENETRFWNAETTSFLTSKEGYEDIRYYLDYYGPDDDYLYFLGRGPESKTEFCNLKASHPECEGYLGANAISYDAVNCDKLRDEYAFDACKGEVAAITNKVNAPIVTIMEYFEGVGDVSGISSSANEYSSEDVAFAAVTREQVEALVQCTQVQYTACNRGVETSIEEKKNVFTIPNVSGLNKMGSVSIPTVIGRAIKGVLSVMGTIAFVMYMYGGILYMTAAGNSSKEEKAKKVLVWTTLGLVVILASYIIVNFVFEAFR